MGYVYIISNGQGLYKIGWTGDHVEKRLRALQVGSPHRLEVVYTERSSDAETLERQFHERFAAKHFRGEWFQLDPDDLRQFSCSDLNGWNQLVSIECRLDRVLSTARSFKADDNPLFCQNHIWYGVTFDVPGVGQGISLKEAVSRLVGWDAWHPKLKTEAAYDLAYDTVYDALPPCRHPGLICP